VAVAFVSMLKLATHWFAPRQFALASGLALLFGVVGGVIAGVPLRHADRSLGLASGDGRFGGPHRPAGGGHLAARPR
jgi:hypothetical protein